jgi:hypothetical protein
VIHPPVPKFVGRRVPLNSERALRGDQDATRALGDERTEDIVQRYEREPKPKVFAQGEDIDLPRLVDVSFVEDCESSLRGRKAPSPPGASRRH